jgi:hypothetical protein
MYGAAKRACSYCDQLFRPRVNDQRFCRPWCRAQGKAREAKSARRLWASAGRPLISDDRDLRFARDREQTSD